MVYAYLASRDTAEQKVPQGDERHQSVIQPT
ncbi:UNVERIFIED_ORG: hypothetical protein J2Y76_003498 [Pseudomonas reinekei]|nr:hypothetical protein [Pseudomonas reinekei]MDF9905985.1 hypothetical protein [Pseudomonas reinekei]